MDVTRPGLAALLHALSRMLYPPRCQLCNARGSDGRDLCRDCHLSLPLIETACIQCALPLAGASGPQQRCGHCLSSPPHFDRSIALMRYEKEAVGMVTRLKFRRRLQHARLLSQLLAGEIAERCPELPDAILPVPLHASRLRQRGFNQSVELSRELAKSLQRPLLLHAVERVRRTDSQTGFDRRQRRRNIRGAFAVTGAIDAQHVAILDDVVTTASTVNEIARVLKRAGVKRVDVWSVARAV